MATAHATDLNSQRGVPLTQPQARHAVVEQTPVTQLHVQSSSRDLGEVRDHPRDVVPLSQRQGFGLLRQIRGGEFGKLFEEIHA